MVQVGQRVTTITKQEETLPGERWVLQIPAAAVGEDTKWASLVLSGPTLSSPPLVAHVCGHSVWVLGSSSPPGRNHFSF